jgi:hypothetical protein
VAAVGPGPLTYQWRHNLYPIAGATAPTLVIADVQPSDQGPYDVLVSDAEGYIDSTLVTLTVDTIPTILDSPQSVSLVAGGSTTLTVLVTGVGFAGTYQWQKNGANIPGATDTTLTLNNVQLSDNGSVYTVVISNPYGSATSGGAVRTVLAAPIPPVFTLQPVGATVTPGTAVNLSAAASGTPTPTYQWYLNGAAIMGSTATSYSIASAQPADGGNYTVIATNSGGSVTSVTAAVIVLTAPTIVTQPASQSVPAGSPAGFMVVASGTPNPSYQWYFNGNAIPGGTNPSYEIESVEVGNAGSYTVVVSNSQGSVTSAAATLVVSAPSSGGGGGTSAPAIVDQPAGQAVTVGRPVTFTVEASGSPAPTLQWYFDAGAIPGATNASYTIASVQAGNAGAYTVVATNPLGSATSNVATLLVLNSTPGGGIASNAPRFTTQPQSQTVRVGGTVSFAVTASGAPAPAYQWYFDGQAIPNATLPTLALGGVTATDSGSFTVAATNSSGSVLSSPALLTVAALSDGPVIVDQPVAQTVAPGSTVVFSITPGELGSISTFFRDLDPSVRPGAAAASNLVVLYQWFLNGSAIANATDPILAVTASAATAGAYQCLVTIPYGAVLSAPALLTVASSTNPGRLGNLSVNTALGAGQLLTVGFVSGGAGTAGSQTLLVRASGPALTAFGVAGVIPDPQLKIFDGNQDLVAADAGWANSPVNQAAVTAADAATFAFPLSDPGSKDSAAVVTVPASSTYTAQVNSVSGVGGVVLAEVFDDTPGGAFSATTPRLTNLSCQLQVTPGGTLTEGFTIGGTTAKTVLIRASGPALAAFGVTGTMPDPQLAAYDSTQTLVASNAGWGGDPQIAAAANAVFAFQFANPTSADSAILITLAPGSYTVQGSSVSGAGGVVLLEVYEVP